jgi:hypothetical protein
MASSKKLTPPTLATAILQFLCDSVLRFSSLSESHGRTLSRLVGTRIEEHEGNLGWYVEGRARGTLAGVVQEGGHGAALNDAIVPSTGACCSTRSASSPSSWLLGCAHHHHGLLA